MITILKSLKPNKYKFLIFLIISLILVINVIDFGMYYIREKFNYQISNKIENRLIYVSTDNDNNSFDNLKKISNVKEIYYNSSPILIETYNKNKYYISLMNPTIDIKVTMGKTSATGINEVIVPINFAKKEEKNIKNLLNKKIKVNIDGKNVLLKVIGIYSQKDNLNNLKDYIYLSKNNNVEYFSSSLNRYIVEVTDAKNLKKVEKELLLDGFEVEYYENPMKNELQTYSDFMNFLKLFIFICNISLVILLILTTFLNIIEKQKQISLLKSLGYSDLYLLFVNSLIYLFIIVLSFIFSLFCFLIFGLFFKTSIFFELKILITNFIKFSIFLIFTNSIIFFKLRRISIIKILKKSL